MLYYNNSFLNHTDLPVLSMRSVFSVALLDKKNADRSMNFINRVKTRAMWAKVLQSGEITHFPLATDRRCR